jgi:hypothetical protein
MKASKGLVAGFWISTALFALQMSFTAYAQLRLPQVAEVFAHLGFPAYFRIELSWAKLAGVPALRVPMVPARLKEWAYAGFAITLVSALVAHLADHHRQRLAGAMGPRAATQPRHVPEQV